MLRALDHDTDTHGQRLDALLQSFRAQEQAMTAVLQEMQAQLEHWHREAIYLRDSSPIAAAALLDRCGELQTECDLVATELVHMRMAVSGTGEELADHRVRLVRSGLALDRRARPA